MNIIEMILNDPIVLFAFIGLAIVLGIGSFYVYYFLKKISNEK